jgi:hypothetical protein
MPTAHPRAHEIVRPLQHDGHEPSIGSLAESSMSAFLRTAMIIGTEWAEQTYGKMSSRGEGIPPQWPGTAEQALELVVTDDIDRFDVEELAFEVNQVARETWRELI